MNKDLKISLLLVFLTGLSVLTNAQNEKGDFVVSASSSLEFSSLSSETTNGINTFDEFRINTFGFSPGVGYFIFNNLAIGLQYSLDRYVEKEEPYDYTETTHMVLPFAQLYFFKSNTRPFLIAAYGPGRFKSGYEEKDTQKISAYQLGGGLAVFVSQHLSLEFGLAYGSATAKYKASNQDDWTTLTKGFGGNIGFSIIL